MNCSTLSSSKVYWVWQLIPACEFTSHISGCPPSSDSAEFDFVCLRFRQNFRTEPEFKWFFLFLVNRPTKGRKVKTVCTEQYDLRLREFQRIDMRSLGKDFRSWSPVNFCNFFVGENCYFLCQFARKLLSHSATRVHSFLSQVIFG